MNRSLTLASLPLVAALAACATPGARADRGSSRRVDAEGWAALDAKDPAGTRRRALADAQKEAVEKASGVAVSARLEVRDAAALSEALVARAQGRLLSYEVLGERERAGGLEIRIRAVVSLDPKEARPCPAATVAVAAADAGVERALRRGLLAQGCSLAAPGERPAVVLRARARVFAVADARVQPFLSYGARLDVQAVDSASGRVVWDGGARAAALGRDAGSAAESALDEAGLSASADAARVLAASY